jgi:hypothetical protein
MAYATTNPPIQLKGGFNENAPSLYTYQSTDAAATVVGAGYFTNGRDLGMKLGDVVIVQDTDDSYQSTNTRVTAVNATTGAVTVTAFGS